MFKLFFYVILLSVLFISCGVNEGSIGLEEETELKKSNNILLPDSNNLSKKNKELTLFKGYLNKEYAYNVKSEKELDSNEFYIYEGELPKGLELDETKGLIFGSPKETGNFKIKIAVKDKEDSELIIIPANISIDDNIKFYKDVRSFIDISKSSKSHTINHNQVINISSSPAKNFFNFYGEGISEIKVCQQGYLKLGGGNCSLASDMQDRRIIAPFADPELILGNDSNIHYQIRGDQPRRMLIVQFRNMHRTTDANASQNFEVILYEDTDRITFLYSLSYPGSDIAQKHLGTNAIIGLASLNNKRKIIAPENQATSPKPQIFNGTVISFTHDATTNQYKKVLDTNVVTDFVDISRYLEETESCTADSQCVLTDKCFQGKCAAKILTNQLMYDGVKKVKLPFSFNFYGSSFNDVKVHENGYLFFGDENYSFYPTVPRSGDAKPVSTMDLEYVIAGMYSDIDLKSVRGGNILYNVIGTSPNRKAIFLYDKVRIKDHNSAATHICTFEMVLHESSNVIQFLYGTNNKSDFCNGKVSTIGLKKNFAEYASITANNGVLNQGKSITFVPNDSIGGSYTWVGVGNVNKNSVTTNGSSGQFTQVPSQWALIDDLPARNFIRYEQTIDTATNRWIPSGSASSFTMGDDSYATLTINGASFNLYGLPRTVFYIQSNGAITTNPNTMNYNEPSNFNYNPSSGKPDTGIFPYWNDLNPRNGGEIRYGIYTRGGDPEYILMIEWNNIPRYSNHGNFRFQLQMHQDGQKYLCYQEVNPGGGDASYLTGIRNNKNDYLQYNGSLNALVSTQKCISYTPIYAYPPNHISGNRSTVTDHDGGEENVPLGFTYNFQGSTYNNITISSNGIAKFENPPTTNIEGHNKKLSSINSYDDSLALFWDNLNPRLNTLPGAGVFYKTLGTAPHRSFLLSYNSVPHGSDSDSRINAQLLIEEGSSDILYCYGYLGGAYHSGDSATVGVRKTNTNFTQLLYKQALLSSNTCYLWTPPIPGFVEARNIYTGETNSDFIDIPVENPNPDGIDSGIFLDPLYYDDDEGVNKPYMIYDLEAQNYNFTFKGKEYKQLFVDANGAVSFGNDNDAAIVAGPMWGDVFYQEDITNKSHISLQSQYENVENDFMWIANAGANTLSKINTHTGVKIGEWPVGSSPSRTAVGFDGSVWVGNRGSHDVTKLNRDGSFVCTVQLHNGCRPRALALDKDENLWVGCCGNGYVYKVKHNRTGTGDTCEILDLDLNTSNNTIGGYAFKGHSGKCLYGFAIDKQGALWSSGIGANILRIDTNKSPTDQYFYKDFPTPANLRTYGVAVDQEGNIWHARWDRQMGTQIGVIKSVYNPVNRTLSSQWFPSKNNGYVSRGRGVAVDANGNIWVAYSYASNGKVGKYAPDGTALELFNINTNTGPNGGHQCTRPIGVGVDGDGDVWVNCQSNGHSEELDANTGQELSNFYTGNSPYCYSDNTGFNLRNIVSEIKPAKYYAKVVEKIESDSAGNEICARVLVVEWRDVRIKTEDNYGYTESTFEMIFDNGYRYDILLNAGRKVCDTTNPPTATPNVTIKYLYGAMQGNKFSQKTGGQSTITMKSLYSNYNHMFGDSDSGTVNSGSKLVITSKK